MKKIILLGDSIRKGYDSVVRKAFEGTAEVDYPEENCRFAAYTLRSLPIWKDERGWPEETAAVHWNAGLWDCLHLPDGEVLTPIDVYGAYIERISSQLRAFFPKAEIIFAASTPVIEEGYTGTFRRYNAEIEAYNEKATEIAMRHGFAVNDLYTAVKDAPKEIHSDMTHYYTKEGTRILAGKVISCLEERLGLKAEEIDYDALFASGENVLGI